MKKLKYFLLTLCAVVMCACCFSFKTNKVEAASININDDLKLVSMDIVDKDGQAGYELNLRLTNEIVSLLNLGRNTISYDQYETSALVIVCDYSGNSYNSTEFDNDDSINKSTFSYYNFPTGLSYSVYSTFSSSIVKCLEGVPNKDCCYVNENIDKFTNNFNVFIPHQMYSIGSDYLTVSDYTFYAFVFNYVEFYTTNSGKFEFYDYDILYKSNKYVLSSTEKYKNYLKQSNYNNIEESIAVSYLKVLNNYQGKDTSLRIKYKGFNEYKHIVDKYIASVIPEEYKYNEYFITDLIKQGFFKFKDYNDNEIIVTDRSDFNVKYDNFVKVGEFDGLIDSTIVLQVDTDNWYTLKNFGDYTDFVINYNDFQYSDFSIRVESNSTEYPNLFTLISSSSEQIESGNIILTYEYSDLENILNNLLLWTIQPDLSNCTILVNGEADFETKYYYGISVRLVNSSIVVTVPVNSENNLMNVNISIQTEIVPPCEIKGYLVYKKFSYTNGKLSSTDVTVDLSTELELDDGILHQSDVYNLTYLSNIERLFPVVVSSLTVSGMEDISYVKLKGVSLYRDTLSNPPVYRFVVEYSFNTIFEITEVFNNQTKITNIRLISSDLMYDTSWFESQCQGFGNSSYISNIEIDEFYANSTSKIVENRKFQEFRITCDLLEVSIIPVTITYSDAIFVEFDYFEMWQLNTPFAIKKTFANHVPYSTVTTNGEINFSKDVIVKILGKSADLFSDSVKINEIAVEETGDFSYYLTLTYTSSVVKTITYDGVVYDLNVSLTSFADWCEMMGVDWMITSLNNESHRYFKSNIDIDESATEKENRELLYGFFSVMIFDERVTDLNYWFKEQALSGCVVAYESTVATGDYLYQFFYENEIGIIFSEVYKFMGMAFCEIVNSNAKMLYYNFFYIDVFDSTTPTLSQTGSTDSDDGDAKDNWSDDIFKNLKEELGPMFETMSTIFTVLFIIIGGLFGLIIVMLIVRLCMWLFKGIGNIKPSGSSSGGSSPKPKKKKRKKIKGGKNKRE